MPEPLIILVKLRYMYLAWNIEKRLLRCSLVFSLQFTLHISDAVCANKVCGLGTCVASIGVATCQCRRGAVIDSFSGQCIGKDAIFVIG